MFINSVRTTFTAIQEFFIQAIENGFLDDSSCIKINLISEDKICSASSFKIFCGSLLKLITVLQGIEENLHSVNLTQELHFCENSNKAIFHDGVSMSSISLSTDFLESVETTEFTHHPKNASVISNNSANERQDLLLPIGRVERMEYQETNLNMENCSNVSYMNSEIHSLPQMDSFRQPFSTFRSSDQKNNLTNNTTNLIISSNQNYIQKFVSDCPINSNNSPNLLLKETMGQNDVNNRTSTEGNSLARISESASDFSSLSVEVGLRTEFSLDQLNTGMDSSTFSSSGNRVKRNNDIQIDKSPQIISNVEEKSTTGSTDGISLLNICSLCDRSFRNNRCLVIHLKQVHKSEEQSSIQLTEKEASFIPSLSSLNLPFYCCKICGSSCTDISEFEFHSCTELKNKNNFIVRSIVTDKTGLSKLKKFVCVRCGVEFRDFSRISYHLPKCLPGPYACQSCSISFNSLRELNYHKGKNHSGEMCFICTECGKSFMRKSSLRKHCVNHHESKSPSTQLSRSLQCDSCPKRFVKKIFLTNHKLRVHEIEKKFACQICGKKLMSENSLSIHMDIHKGDKRFSCRFCPKKFLRKEKLICHERIHTGDRPFPCNTCNKRFVSLGKLNEHIRRHLAEKRFQCSKCDKSYASVWDVKRHARNKHNIDLSSQRVKVFLRNNQSKGSDQFFIRED